MGFFGSSKKAEKAHLQLSYHQRVHRLFYKYDQRGLALVSQILAQHAGKEETCVKQLVKRLGPEPPKNDESVPILTDDAIKSACTVGLADRDGTRATQPVSTSAAAPPIPWKARFAAFFEHYDPKQLSKLDDMLSIAHGKESQIMAALVKRYGPEVVVDDTRSPTASPPPAAAPAAEASRPPSTAPASSTPPVSWVQRFHAMFARYDSTQLSKVPDLVAMSVGREASVMAALVARYGPEPQTIHLTDSGSEAEGRVEPTTGQAIGDAMKAPMEAPPVSPPRSASGSPMHRMDRESLHDATLVRTPSSSPDPFADTIGTEAHAEERPAPSPSSTHSRVHVDDVNSASGHPPNEYTPLPTTSDRPSRTTFGRPPAMAHNFQPHSRRVPMADETPQPTNYFDRQEPDHDAAHRHEPNHDRIPRAVQDNEDGVEDAFEVWDASENMQAYQGKTLPSNSPSGAPNAGARSTTDAYAYGSPTSHRQRPTALHWSDGHRRHDTSGHLYLSAELGHALSDRAALQVELARCKSQLAERDLEVQRLKDAVAGLSAAVRLLENKTSVQQHQWSAASEHTTTDERLRQLPIPSFLRLANSDEELRYSGRISMSATVLSLKTFKSRGVLQSPRWGPEATTTAPLLAEMQHPRSSSASPPMRYSSSGADPSLPPIGSLSPLRGQKTPPRRNVSFGGTTDDASRGALFKQSQSEPSPQDPRAPASADRANPLLHLSAKSVLKRGSSPMRNGSVGGLRVLGPSAACKHTTKSDPYDTFRINGSPMQDDALIW